MNEEGAREMGASVCEAEINTCGVGRNKREAKINTCGVGRNEREAETNTCGVGRNERETEINTCEPEENAQELQENTYEYTPAVGTFTGTGVGPGDPELMTIKAVRAVETSGCIAIPVSDRSFGRPVCVQSEADRERYRDYLNGCVAYQIALGAVPEMREKPVLLLPMPMIKDRDELRRIHDRDADAVGALLDQGQDVVFLTLGDPTVYSTCMYLHRRLKRAGYPTALIPGIPSFCAAAARLDIPLAENSEELHILPASYGIGENLQLPGTKVLMKSGRKMAEIQSILRGHEWEVCMVENCGMESEKVWHRAEDLPGQAGYYSLLIVKDKES